MFMILWLEMHMSVERIPEKHILFLIDELKVKGGTEKHLHELACEMIRAGFRVSVFTFQEGDYAREFMDDSRIHYVCLDVTRIYNAKGLLAILRLADYIRSQRVDILQTFHTASDLVGPLASVLSLKRPVVLSSRRDLGYTKSPRHIKMQRLINRYVDGILANSCAVKNALVDQEAYQFEKIKVIYNGIHTNRFFRFEKKSSELADKHGIPLGGCIIGSVGNIRPVKGFDSMVEVAIRLCKSNSDVYFVHAGEGAGRAILEDSCKTAGIENQFKFLGNQECIPELLSLLDIYMQPSRSEGFSNSILEAMASGLPVVATRVGGNPEIIDHLITGYLVEPDDVGGMVDCLAQLVREEKLRQAMGKAGREKVKYNFDIACMAGHYERYYHELLES